MEGWVEVHVVGGHVGQGEAHAGGLAVCTGLDQAKGGGGMLGRVAAGGLGLG